MSNEPAQPSWPRLQIAYRPPHGRGGTLRAHFKLDGLPENPYALVQAWNRQPRLLRLALVRAGLDARGFVTLALTIYRQLAAGVPQERLRALRVGPGLEVGLEEPSPPPAESARVVVMRHPEWTGEPSLAEGRYYSR